MEQPSHKWQQWEFLPSAPYGNMITCVQVWRCEKCHEREGLPMGVIPNSGVCSEKKPAWICPMPTPKLKDEVDKKDYPAKKRARR